MQFSVYDIITKVDTMEGIIDRIDHDYSIVENKDEIRDLLQEYMDILKCAKVNI